MDFNTRIEMQWSRARVVNADLCRPNQNPRLVPVLEHFLLFLYKSIPAHKILNYSKTAKHLRLLWTQNFKIYLAFLSFMSYIKHKFQFSFGSNDKVKKTCAEMT